MKHLLAPRPYPVVLLALALAQSPLRAADDALLLAAKQGDRAAVAKLLAAKAPVTAASLDGATPLHWAAYHEDVEMAELLLRAGADAKAKNHYGISVLQLACTNGNGAIVELLLAHGANPNDTQPGGQTALMTAARTGKLEAVQALLRKGANPNAAEEKNGQTALMWAAAEGNTEVVSALVKAGANVKARVESGFTPLLFAVREGKLETARRLVEQGAEVGDTIQPFGKKATPRGAAPRAGTSALVLATLNGHFAVAAMLLDAGADPNANGAGYTALHAISWVRKPGLGDNNPAPVGSGSMTSLELVRKLASQGADLNSRMTRRIGVGMTSLNTLGATPFLLAARTADAELMRLLASLGADPKLPNADGSTPLIVAAGLGTRSPGEDAGLEEEVVEALDVALRLGNDPNAVDKNGETAMHGAAYKNLPAAVAFLAAHGADIAVWNKKNRFGWTPLRIAEGYRFGNYKPSPVTMDAFHKVMRAAGVEPVSEPAISPESLSNSDYKKKP